MRIHLLSDIHIDNRRPVKVKGQPKHKIKATYIPSVTDADVVVLAGDIHTKGRGVAWAVESFPNSQVIYVPGNHEFWGENHDKMVAKMKAMADGTQVHVLDREAIVISGVRFLVAVGWTDFRGTGNQPLAMIDAEMIMKDHRKIRHGIRYMRWRPYDAQRQAMIARAWLEDRLAEPFDGPTVVVTHHPMSMLSVRKTNRKTPHLDASYGNAWEHILLNAQDAGVDLRYALHGHTHDAVDYEIGTTRVLSNPVGHAFENTGYNPWLVIEI